MANKKVKRQPKTKRPKFDFKKWEAGLKTWHVAVLTKKDTWNIRWRFAVRADHKEIAGAAVAGILAEQGLRFEVDYRDFLVAEADPVIADQYPVIGKAALVEAKNEDGFSVEMIFDACRDCRHAFFHRGQLPEPHGGAQVIDTRRARSLCKSSNRRAPRTRGEA